MNTTPTLHHRLYHALYLLYLLSATTATASPPPQPPEKPTIKPSITVVAGVLTVMFSLTFLLLLYAKHCRRQTTYDGGGGGGGDGVSDRKNSGVDRSIIGSLPVFRFGSLSGQKDGLECAVCLTKFDSDEVLRLLPKCKHAFHIECVDTWLDAHSTCPLCRARVDPEDILLIQENKMMVDEANVRRVPGRHSSAGERGNFRPVTTSYGSRRSLDSFRKSRKGNGNGDDANFVIERRRKDGMLLLSEEDRRRLQHRIVVRGGMVERWSDVQPSDLLYLRAEMIMSDNRRSVGPRTSISSRNGGNAWWRRWSKGRGDLSSRCLSEMTGLSRFESKEEAAAGGDARWSALHVECPLEQDVLQPGYVSSLSPITSNSHRM